ncbi:cytochrome P450 oxidoreductase, putative [Cordyceps militaris CM01]|uniref:Cytochrome P450 oxidoreductase, putative n=1 Tax=Cordyceps militaris (strain CM01) TaxID=983644 RepID=G3JJQ1_CORMM|nr:cytochrome P450 oxidoreductase, putative [Cordyceps militaris CM01]EGX91291.1 cytochrome P450 oxidoreductase, putative [Cordyceps militaris CM01]
MNHLFAFLAGHALHLLVFRRGEWDSAARDIMVSAALLYVGAAVALHAASGPAGGSWWASLHAATTLELAGMAGVFASMLAYRVWFHALCRYPGPWAARLSSLHLTYLSRRFRLFEELRLLHEQYGDIVRIVSICKPEAVEAVHGPKSKCSKGPWYEQAKPLTSLHTNRDPVSYARQRRSWEQGLNSAGKLLLFIALSLEELGLFKLTNGNQTALRGYTPILAKTTQQLLDRIEASRGQTFDASKWFHYFSFEVMGWMAFDKSFDALATGTPTYCMNLITKSLNLIGLLAHIPWFFVWMKHLPVMGATFQVFRKWLRAQMAAQMEKPPGSSRSLFAAILKDYPPAEEQTEKQRMVLEGDMFLILVAGSDTVAVTLQALFYEMAVNQEAQKKLQQEIDAHVAEYGDGGGNGLDPALLAKLDHLQACINETLRLWPPVISGVQRETPPEGLQVGDVRLPGNILVQVPTHLIHRNEEAFPRPKEFIPERWTTKPELVVDRSAFYPFSIGRHSCPGKQFALAELRQATVDILRRYSVELAPGFTSEDFEGGLRDHFTLEASRLELAFTAR